MAAFVSSGSAKNSRDEPFEVVTQRAVDAVTGDEEEPAVPAGGIDLATHGLPVMVRRVLVEQRRHSMSGRPMRRR